jgi:hypothetical protein
VTESRPLSSLWTDPAPDASGPVPVWRRVLGWIAAVAGVVVLVSFTVGTVNPWDNVVLRIYLGNPFLGVLIFCGLLMAAFWLLWPVRNEASQGARVVLRWTSIVVFVISLIAFGLYHAMFAVDTKLVAEAPSGNRAVALVTTPGNDAELHVWAGHGLARHDVGTLGYSCGQVRVRFADENTVHVETVYRQRDLHLDPGTGRPLDRLGPTCTD